MSLHCLTTTQLKVIETEDDDRKYLFSAGLFSTAVLVYVRIGDVGDAAAILCSTGSTIQRLYIPAGRPVYAWTDAGTAELCTAKL